MDKKQFGIIIAMLKSNYKGFIVDDKEKFEFWHEALKDISYEICNNAVLKITMESEFAPTIATIRKAVLEITQGLKLTSADCLELINKSISKFGMYQSLKALEWLKEQDESTYYVVKAIGFPNLCKANSEFIRQPLMKMYSEVSTNNEKANLLPRQFAREIREIQSNGLMLLGEEF